MITFIEYNNISAINSEAAISVDAAGAVAYTIPAGKKGVTFQNVGSKNCWYGGSNVNPTTKIGIKLFRNQGLVFKNVKRTFKIYFKCGGSDSTSVGVINND